MIHFEVREWVFTGCLDSGIIMSEDNFQGYVMSVLHLSSKCFLGIGLI